MYKNWDVKAWEFLGEKMRRQAAELGWAGDAAGASP